jgi:acetyl-CoA synthetase
MADKQLEALLQENRTFAPSKEFVKNAVVSGAKARPPKDRLKFWEDFAKELHWFKKWTKVLDWNLPHAKWFVGGKTNMAYNCLDRHLTTHRRNKAAILWEGEPGEQRTLTYQQLHGEVCRFANGLKSMGIKKGDRVTLYMPMVPELAIAMLACTRIGAPHSVIFGGFSADAVRDRINDCESKLVVTADGGYRRGTVLQLKKIVDEALEGTKTVENVVVLNRVAGSEVSMKGGRDHWWSDVVHGQPDVCPAEHLDAEDMLYLLYTSGTTGKPKGILHTTGGYMTGVYATTKWAFDLKDTDIYWCTADIGWVTGHSYVVYGPLLNGATVLMYEGAPDFPAKDRFWSIIERHKATILYTAPTAIRAFMKWGEDLPKKHDLSSLRLLGSVGEPINPEAWMWYHRVIGGERCPIIDTWWQTETGHMMITPLPSVTKTKPGSACTAFPGIDIDVVNEKGESVDAGLLVIKSPWPGMLRGIYGDPERYKQTYWSKFPKWYFAGDGAKRDKQGYLWLLGRVDDVLKVSGHRLSTMEIESALVDHRSVAEAAVIGKHHEIKENAIVAFVSLRAGSNGGPELLKELKDHVVKKIGSLARPDDIFFTAELPKTRSGKIMRRLLRDIAEGRAIGDTTTLADVNVVKGLKEQYEDKEG